jgi:hypothetical protein
LPRDGGRQVERDHDLLDLVPIRPSFDNVAAISSKSTIKSGSPLLYVISAIQRLLRIQSHPLVGASRAPSSPKTFQIWRDRGGGRSLRHAASVGQLDAVRQIDRHLAHALQASSWVTTAATAVIRSAAAESKAAQARQCRRLSASPRRRGH